MNKENRPVPVPAPAPASRTVRKSSPSRGPASAPALTLLVTVVDRSKGDVFLEFIRAAAANFQLSMAAEGTADSETRALTGLTDAGKSVIFSVIRQDRSAKVLSYLEEKFRTVKNGKGIAFTVPMTGIIGVAVYQFLQAVRKEGSDS